MTLKLYNTLTQSTEDFQPLDSSHVKMYVCGPTVYDRIHLGNAWPVVVFDVLYRLLKHLYPKVTYARNLTDVDDKINARAAETGQAIQDLTKMTTQYFHDDIAALNVLAPDKEPRATDHIQEMIDMIKTLIEKGHAYEAEEHVLFQVKTLDSYGELSRRNLEDMIAGARVEVAPYKKDPADFVLWKPSDDDIPGWDSPWGRGRPGWHIECSAMSCKYLGHTFDIHGGGRDLTFPHHENEIAQSKAAHGSDTFAKTWMHNGMLTVEGEKMSKSLGNFITLNKALEGHRGEVIRFMLMSTHYRKSLDWTEDGLTQAKHALDRLYNALKGSTESGEVSGAVLEALKSDLNTPLAISHLHDLASQINKNPTPELQATLRASGQFLGLFNHSVEDWFQGEGDLSAEAIESLIQERAQAKAGKDFSKADQIRDSLKEQGVILEDSAGGTTWRRD